MQELPYEIFLGDSQNILKTLPENLVHSVVTDPPAGINFLNKKWDSNRGGRDEWIKWLNGIMRECYRVLKPGGYALIWAIPRTSHWTATAVENAGFQIKDVITHLFGSGFPKSQDIARLIRTSKLETASDGNFRLQEVSRWQGWGTALKPSSEHWILAQKPISEINLATNLIRHGVGALNIDAARIKTLDKIQPTQNIKFKRDLIFNAKNAERGDYYHPHLNGRFPANTILIDTKTEESPVKIIDEQAGKNSAKYFKIFSPYFYCAKPVEREKGEFNTHPTVKPIRLMRYLIKLVTPQGGIVLDPFMGSGTTGMSAILENSRFLGIEQDAAYFEIAKKRLSSVKTKAEGT